MKKINPIQYAFITAIDLGIRYPIYLYNTFGMTYPITSPYEMITYADNFRVSLRNTNDIKEKLKIREVYKKHFSIINNALSDYVISLCPCGTFLALEDLHNPDWMDCMATQQLLKKLVKKAKKKYIQLVRVDPTNTSNMCPRCGNINKVNRDKGKHLYRCDKCGLVCNDDGIAAWNIHNRAYYMITGKEYVTTIHGEIPVINRQYDYKPFDDIMNSV